jgi:hypothetical protein
MWNNILTALCVGGGLALMGVIVGMWCAIWRERKEWDKEDDEDDRYYG